MIAARFRGLTGSGSRRGCRPIATAHGPSATALEQELNVLVVSEGFIAADVARVGGCVGAPETLSSPRGSRDTLPAMEFANLTLILVTAWMVWKRPDKERTAFALLVTSVLLTVFLFFLGTRSSILPPVNY